jgi:hypothetical protein
VAILREITGALLRLPVPASRAVVTIATRLCPSQASSSATKSRSVVTLPTGSARPSRRRQLFPARPHRGQGLGNLRAVAIVSQSLAALPTSLIPRPTPRASSPPRPGSRRPTVRSPLAPESAPSPSRSKRSPEGCGPSPPYRQRPSGHTSSADAGWSVLSSCRASPLRRVRPARLPHRARPDASSLLSRARV